jgi:hypothetical protein
MIALLVHLSLSLFSHAVAGILLQGQQTQAQIELAHQNLAKAGCQITGIHHSSKIGSRQLSAIEGFSESTQHNVVELKSLVGQQFSSLQHSLTVIDQKIQSSRSPDPLPKLSRTCHTIPYPENQHFVGRKQVLRVMRETLIFDPRNPQCNRSFTLHGMPGVGKTHTALQFVHDHMKDFMAIFWISASSTEKVTQGYISAARALKGGQSICTVTESQREIEDVHTWLRNTGESLRSFEYSLT